MKLISNYIFHSIVSFIFSKETVKYIIMVNKKTELQN